MSHIDAKCSLIVVNGAVIGISLVAEPQCEAEMFCASLPRLIINDSAKIVFGEGTINFVHPVEGTVSFEIEAEDARALSEVFNGSQRLGFYSAGTLTPGFKIVPQGMEHVGVHKNLKMVAPQAATPR